MANKIIDRKNLTFLIALFFEVFAMLISITTIPYMVDTENCNLILKLLRYTGYAIVLFKIFCDDYSSKQMTVILIIIAILVMNSIKIGGNTILCLFLFVIGMREVDFKLVCKISLIWYLAGIIITITSSQLVLSRIGIIHLANECVMHLDSFIQVMQPQSYFIQCAYFAM